MSKEQELEKQFKEFQRLAEENKDVDVKTLMVNALDRHISTTQPSKQGRGFVGVGPVLWSLGMPVIGIYYLIRYLVADDGEEKRQALICMIVSAVSLFIYWYVSSILFSGKITPI
jgi:hypothetical protein